MIRHQWQDLFLVIFVIFYLYFFTITNRNPHAISQEFDLIKQYTNWFYKHPNRLSNDVNILVYSKNHPMQKSSSWINYFVLDYYWKGYDDRKPLPNYKKIKTDEDLKQKHFYLLTVSEFENEEEKDIICPNSNTLQISRFEKRAQQTSDLYYYDSLDVYIYECNP